MIKCISQINDLIMFFRNLRIRFFKNYLAQIWIMWKELIQEKGTQST